MYMEVLQKILVFLFSKKFLIKSNKNRCGKKRKQRKGKETRTHIYIRTLCEVKSNSSQLCGLILYINELTWVEQLIFHLLVRIGRRAPRSAWSDRSISEG